MGNTDSDPRADLDLARRALAGDGPAMGTLLERLRCVPRMLAQRNARLGRPFGREELEDVSQEVLIAVWRKLETFRGECPLEAWVHRFAQLELLYRLRRKDRRLPLAADVPAEDRPEPEVEDRLPDPFEQEQVQDALERLGPPESDILRMRHFEELAFGEIAERLGAPLNTTKTRYYRGLQKVRNLLGSAAAAAGGGT